MLLEVCSIIIRSSQRGVRGPTSIRGRGSAAVHRIIVEGFLRVFITGASSGRENTIRCVRLGELLGWSRRSRAFCYIGPDVRDSHLMVDSAHSDAVHKATPDRLAPAEECRIASPLLWMR
jgi:hypothetical protein